MEIFLSWSGARSKALAEELKTWIQLVIQAAEPWISEDIQKGVRWGPEVQERLAGCQLGIVCITPENQHQPWLLFEAGALARVKDTNVCTLLLGLGTADVRQPLAMFNHTEANKEDVLKLMQTINTKLGAVGEKSVREEQLKESFEAFWPRLGDTISRLASEGSPDPVPARGVEDMTREILDVVRDIYRSMSASRSAGKLSDLLKTGSVSIDRFSLLPSLRDKFPGVDFDTIFNTPIQIKMPERNVPPDDSEPSSGTGSTAPPEKKS
jgi:hypothetical protein